MEKEKLEKALDKVYPLISKGTDLFHFYNDKVYVVDEINQIILSHPFTSEINGSIKAVELYKFIKNVTGNRISIKNEDNTVSLKTRTAKTQLTKVHTQPLEDKTVDNWNTIPDNVIPIVQKVVKHCSKNKNEPSLNGVHIKDKVIEATDTYNLSQYQLDEPFPVDEVTIPSKITNLLDSFTQIAQNDTFLFFSNEEGTVIQCTLITDKFPDTKNIIKNSDGVSITLPEEIKPVIDTASIFAEIPDDKINETVRITFNNNQAIVSAKSSTGSEFENIVDCEYTGEEFTILINPAFLKKQIKDTNNIEISKRLIKFIHSDHIHITMLREIV